MWRLNNIYYFCFSFNNNIFLSVVVFFIFFFSFSFFSFFSFFLVTIVLFLTAFFVALFLCVVGCIVGYCWCIGLHYHVIRVVYEQCYVFCYFILIVVEQYLYLACLE